MQNKNDSYVNIPLTLQMFLNQFTIQLKVSNIDSES